MLMFGESEESLVCNEYSDYVEWQQEASLGCRWRKTVQMWRVAVTANKGRFSIFRVGKGFNNSLPQNKACNKTAYYIFKHFPLNLKQWKQLGLVSRAAVTKRRRK